MSKKRGTSEKAFEPLYVAGQDAAEFKKRVWKNSQVAVSGGLAEEKYAKAHRVYLAWTAIKLADDLIKVWQSQVSRMSQAEVRLFNEITKERPGRLNLLQLKEQQQGWLREILIYIEMAFQKKDGKALRMLADVAEKSDVAVSPDAAELIKYCASKPHDYIFTFNELIQQHALHQGLKKPYDEAIVKRVRRLIKNLGIRVRKGQ